MVLFNNLSKTYNGTIVLDITQLTINKTELVGLVGNNGAGKTTLFRLMLDLIPADKGKVLIGEYDVAASDLWKAFVAAYLDDSFLISYLTPYEYFYFVGKLHKLTKPSVDEALQKFTLFLDEALYHKGYIRDLSRGNQFKIGITACLLWRPEVLILDEPFANLDPTSQIRLKSILKEISENYKITILISSHDLNHITDLCKRILLLEKGRIIKDIITDSETIHELEDYFKI